MKKINLFIAAFTIFAVVSGCKKEDDAPATSTTTTPATVSVNKTNLTGKTFKMTAWTSAPAWKGFTNIYSVTTACYKDNTVVYNTDGTLLVDEGATKCNSGDAQTVSGTWKFNTAETQLIVNDTVVYDIVTNDGATLKYTTEFIDTSATPDATLIWTFTFTKQ